MACGRLGRGGTSVRGLLKILVRVKLSAYCWLGRHIVGCSNQAEMLEEGLSYAGSRARGRVIRIRLLCFRDERLGPVGEKRTKAACNSAHRSVRRPVSGVSMLFNKSLKGQCHKT